jgi:hypothetical protein
VIDADLEEQIAVDRGYAWMAEARPLCAYFRGVSICSFGCWEEPVCYTEEPSGGWHWAAYERYMDLAETLRAIVREDRAELTHADVKNLRDQAREAHRRALLNLAVADA